MEKIQKNDFVEISFTGKANGKIFDTTNKDEAKEIHENVEVKPMIICVGSEMILKGIDEELEGKELKKKYFVHLTPEKAFGKRNPSLIKTYSLNSFTKNKINPYPGLTLQMDNHLVKIISVNGGRVTVDFNNPLAGKEIDYEFIINKKITDEKDKVNALQDYFFRQRFNFEIDEKSKKVVFKDKIARVFLELLGEKFREMTRMEFVVEGTSENKEKKGENKKEGTNSKKDKSKKPLS